jgi:hypothetical protein
MGKHRKGKNRYGGNGKGGGGAKRIKDKDTGRSMEGVIQKVKYIVEGRGRNEVLCGRGVQNTVIGLGVSEEIDREPAQYPQGTRLGTAKISNIQSPVLTSMTATNFRDYSKRNLCSSSK